MQRKLLHDSGSGSLELIVAGLLAALVLVLAAPLFDGDASIPSSAQQHTQTVDD